jgi:hypothetical protein
MQSLINMGLLFPALDASQRRKIAERSVPAM